MLLRDSYSAKDTKLDIRDKAYPLGVMVLVLDAVEVYKELITNAKTDAADDSVVM